MDPAKKRHQVVCEVPDKAHRQSTSRKRRFHPVVDDNVRGARQISGEGSMEGAPRIKCEPKEGMLRPTTSGEKRSSVESSAKPCSSARVKGSVRLPSLGLTGRRGTSSNKCHILKLQRKTNLG